jgi:hypothetical protein
MDFEVTDDGTTVSLVMEVRFWVEKFKMRFSLSAVLEMVTTSSTLE